MYLCQVQVILLHIHEMVPDQKLHCLYVVFVLIAAFNQTPVKRKTASKLIITKYTISEATLCPAPQGI